MKRIRCGVGLLLLALGLSQLVGAQSLYDEQTFRALTADRKALRVGDVLTVQVTENASATANADTGTQRRNNLGAHLSLSWPHQRTVDAAAVLGGEFDGGGRTVRAGRVLAQLTVSVRDVLANGDLLIAGEQLLTINDEAQRIAVSGRVRPQDVSDGNVVASSRIADAEITYVGDGELADRQKKPWWRHLSDVLGF